MEEKPIDLIEEKRLEFQTYLEKILGSRNVYYQPPSDRKMKYPCIRYELDRFSEIRADDIIYVGKTGYQVTYIDSEPNLKIPEQIHALPLCRFVRAYVADNLNHYAYLVYI